MNQPRDRPGLTGADLTRLCWLLYVHGGRRENFPRVLNGATPQGGCPRESAGRLEALVLVTIESEWGENDEHSWELAPVEHVEITAKGRAVCEAMVAAGRKAAEDD